MLVAAVVGSGIMGEQLAGGNVAIALLAGAAVWAIGVLVLRIIGRADVIIAVRIVSDAFARHGGWLYALISVTVPFLLLA